METAIAQGYVRLLLRIFSGFDYYGRPYPKIRLRSFPRVQINN